MNPLKRVEPKRRRVKPKKGKPFYTAVDGNVRIPVYQIHLTKPKPRTVFSIMFYEGKGVRKEVKRVNPGDAKQFADDKAKDQNSAKREANRLRLDQRESYVRAQDLAGDTPLTTVVQEWKKAYELTEGQIIPAAIAWRELHNNKIKQIQIAKAVDQFLDSKRADGMVTKTSYEQTLKRTEFQEEFGELLISNVTKRRLQNWLNGFSHPNTRRTHRKRCVTFFRWARTEGFLPLNIQTQAELTSAPKQKPVDIGITDADTYLKLLNLMRENHPHYLAATVLAGLCGMRRKEIHNQLWSDISLDRKFVRVTDAKPGTPAKRLVTLGEAAIEWLFLCENRTGEVCPGTTMFMDRIRFIGKAAGLDLPKNCFRDSYISCRIAATGEIDRTALEAGTSAKMIHNHYRELVTKEEGEDWFSISPNLEKEKVVGFEGG